MWMFLKIGVAGAMALFLGAIPFAYSEVHFSDTPPGEGASFAVLMWLLPGAPICFVLMPVVAYATRNLAWLRWLLYPVAGSLIAVSIGAANGALAAPRLQSEMAMDVTLIPLIWITWYLYLRIFDAEWPRWRPIPHVAPPAKLLYGD